MAKKDEKKNLAPPPLPLQKCQFLPPNLEIYLRTDKLPYHTENRILKILIYMVDPLSPIYSQLLRLQIHEIAPFLHVCTFSSMCRNALVIPSKVH